MVKAAGAVKSVLQPKKAGTSAKEPTKMPSMLKQDQPVNVTADQLGVRRERLRAIYTGAALLWQGETSVKGVDDHHRQQERRPRRHRPGHDDRRDARRTTDKGGKEKVSSIGTSKDFAYEDCAPRATYTGDAHSPVRRAT